MFNIFSCADQRVVSPKDITANLTKSTKIIFPLRLPKNGSVSSEFFSPRTAEDIMSIKADVQKILVQLNKNSITQNVNIPSSLRGKSSEFKEIKRQLQDIQESAEGQLQLIKLLDSQCKDYAEKNNNLEEKMQKLTVEKEDLSKQLHKEKQNGWKKHSWMKNVVLTGGMASMLGASWIKAYESFFPGKR